MENFSASDSILQVATDEGTEIVGFFAKLRNTEVPVVPEQEEDPAEIEDETQIAEEDPVTEPV